MKDKLISACCQGNISNLFTLTCTKITKTEIINRKKIYRHFLKQQKLIKRTKTHKKITKT